MEIKTYRNWRTALMVIIGVIIAVSVTIGNVCSIWKLGGEI